MRLKAILKMKCPYCLQGTVFRGFFNMDPTCEHCGITYERERGYFMMAAFVGYIMGFAIVIPVLLLLYLTVQPSMWGYIIGGVAALLLAIPFIFHYARIIWMHLDQLMDPRQPPSDLS